MRGADLAVEVRDRAAYLPAADALVLADLHLGRTATSAVELPLGERERIEGRLGALVERFEPREVVLAGDVLHSFSSVPAGVAEALDALRSRVEAAGSDLVVVEGNHDTLLPSVAGTVPVHRLDDGTLVHHGHEEPRRGAERYVIGHDHPAIEIEGRRRPCFLLGRGRHRGADVLCLPAFNRLCAGTPVNGLSGEDTHSPLLSELSAFRPVVRDEEGDETFVFPRLGEFRDAL